MSLGAGLGFPGGRGGGGNDDLARAGDAKAGEDVALGGGELGGLPEGAGRAGEGAEGELAELVADLVPGGAGGGLGDADQQQGEPSQEDVGADPLFQPVAGGPQVDYLLSFARQPRSTSRRCLYPAAMSAAGSLGSEARSRYLPSRFSSALTALASIPQQPAGGDPEIPVQPGLGGDHPAQL